MVTVISCINKLFCYPNTVTAWQVFSDYLEEELQNILSTREIVISFQFFVMVIEMIHYKMYTARKRHSQYKSGQFYD